MAVASLVHRSPPGQEQGVIGAGPWSLAGVDERHVCGFCESAECSGKDRRKKQCRRGHARARELTARLMSRVTQAVREDEREKKKMRLYAASEIGLGHSRVRLHQASKSTVTARTDPVGCSSDREAPGEQQPLAQQPRAPRGQARRTQRAGRPGAGDLPGASHCDWPRVGAVTNQNGGRCWAAYRNYGSNLHEPTAGTARRGQWCVQWMDGILLAAGVWSCWVRMDEWLDGWMVGWMGFP